MKNPTNVAAAIGLALGGVFGMLGTMVAERILQAAFWAVDGVGLVVDRPSRPEILQNGK